MSKTKAKVENIHDKLIFSMGDRVLILKVEDIVKLTRFPTYSQGKNKDTVFIYFSETKESIPEEYLEDDTLEKIEEEIKKYYRKLEPKKVMI